MYRVNVPVAESCEIVLGRESMEGVQEFKYFGTVLCRYREMDGEIKVMNGRSVMEFTREFSCQL